MLGIAPDEFEPLGVLGLDSLRALKLKTFLEEMREIPSQYIWTHSSRTWASCHRSNWTRCLANSSPPIIETRGTEHWYMTDVRERIKHLSNEQLRKLQASRPPATATRSTGRRSTTSTSAAPITAAPRYVEERRHQPRGPELHQGSRHGNPAGRSDRDQRAEGGHEALHVEDGLLCHRLDQGEHRVPGGGGRARLPHQDRPDAEAPQASADAALRGAEPIHPAR